MTEDRMSAIIADKMPVRDVTDLRIYQQSMDLLPNVYMLSKQIPERDLRDQLQRAARAIAPMITEGFAKKSSPKEFKRFLRMALGSCDEVRTHLGQVRILYKLETQDLEASYKALSRQISAAIAAWV